MLKNSTRLNKYISESGICSRRVADKYIEHGQVLINGKKATVGDQVFPGDKVMVNGQYIEPKESNNEIFIALNKPVGIVSTTENVKDNIVNFVNHSERIFPIGRLDKDSQGLIFLTNNGDIVNKILRAGNNHEKEYVVTVNKAITEQFIEGMANCVPMMGVTTKKCVVKQEGVNTFRIFLIQGLNRQIRRMCEHFGYDVTKLERTRIMNISLKGIPVGDWRELTPAEMKGIYSMLEKSSSDAKLKAKKPAKKRPEDAFDDLMPKATFKPQKQFKPKSESKRPSSTNSRSKPASKSNNRPKSTSAGGGRNKPKPSRRGGR